MTLSENYVIGMDANQALVGARTMAEAANIVKQAFGIMEGSAARFNVNGDKTSATLNGLTTEGEKLSVMLAKTSQGFKVLGVASTDTARRINDAQASASNFTKNLQGQTSLMASGGSTKEMLKYVSALDAAGEAFKKLEPTQRGVGTNMWASVQADQVKNYKGGLGDLQQALFNVKKAHAGLGDEAKAALEKQKAAAAQLYSLYQSAGQARQTQGFVQGQAAPQLGNATEVQKAAFNTAIGNLKAFQIQTGTSTAAIQQMWAQLGTNGPQVYIGHMAQVQRQVLAVRTAMAQLGSAPPAPAVDKGVLLSWETFARFFEARILYAGITAVTSALREGMSTAIEYNAEIARIKTLSKDTADTQDRWNASVQRVSNAFGANSIDVAKSYYSALSNQIGQSIADVEGYTRSTQRFAQVTAATAEQANNLFSSVINSYGLSIGAVTKLEGELFKTIDLGRVSAGQMSDSIGRILVPAKQLGVAYQEMFAGIAVLTQKGVSPSDSMTQLLNVMNKLIKPSDALKKLFREWGVETGQQAIATFGFTGVLKKLNEELQQHGIARIGEEFNELRGMRGILGLIGTDLNLFIDTLAKITASSGQYATGIDETFNTPFKRMQIEINKIKNYFLVMGEEIIRTIDSVTTPMGGLANVIKGIAALIQGSLAGAMTYFAGTLLTRLSLSAYGTIGALNGLKMAFTALHGVIARNPIGLLVTAIGAVASYFAFAESAAERATRMAAEFSTKMLDEVAKYTEGTSKQLAMIERGIIEKYRAILDAGTKTTTALGDAHGNLNNLLKGYDDVIKKSRDSALGDIDSQITNVNKRISDSGAAVKEMERTLKTLTKEKDAEDFSNLVGPDKTAVQKVKVYIDSITAMQAEAEQAAAGGDIERALLLKDEVLQRNNGLQALLKTTTAKKESYKADEDQARLTLAELNYQGTEIELNDRIRKSHDKIGDSLKRNRKGYIDVEKVNRAIVDNQVQMAKSGNEEEKAQLRIQLVKDKLALKQAEYLDSTQALADAASVNLNVYERMETVASSILKIDKARQDSAKTELEQLKLKRKGIDANYDALIKLTKITASDKIQLAGGLPEDPNSKNVLANYQEIINQLREQGAGPSLLELKGLEEAITLKGKILDLDKQDKALGQEKLNAREKELRDSKDLGKQKDDLKRKTSEEASAFVEAQLKIKSFPSRVETIQMAAARGRASNEFDITTATPDQIKDRLKVLTDYNNMLQSQTTVIDPLGTGPFRREQTGVVAQAIVALQRYKKDAEDLIPIEKKVADATTAMQAFADEADRNQKVADAQVKTTAALAKQTADVAAAINEVTQATRNLMNVSPAARSIVSEPIDNRAAGGYMHGSDNIPAMLARGEFVVSQKNTRRFYSQLIGMNSGISNLASGGRVGGNTFGDINVNMTSSSNASVDAIQLGRAIKREMSRGTVRF